METITLQHLETMEEVHREIQKCEGRHRQQVAFSSFHDALTQICFGCGVVRTSFETPELAHKAYLESFKT